MADIKEEEKIARLEEKVEGLSKRLDRIEARLDRIEERLDKMDEEMKTLYIALYKLDKKFTILFLILAFLIIFLNQNALKFLFQMLGLLR